MGKQTNISKVFIGFVIASALMWLLINLSKTYTTTLKYTVDYKQLPQDKIFQKNPESELDVSVRGSGFNLLAENFSSRNLNFSINQLNNKKGSDYYLLPNNQKRNLQEQLNSVELIQVLKDTIHLQLGSLQSKKVAVLPNVAINYKLGYDIAEKIKVTPDSIVISGPEMQLAQVKNLLLKPLELTNVSENITKKMAIQLPEALNKIKLSQNTANINISVDKFTEGEFEVPVMVRNISDKTKINIFPKKVKVIFKIGLKNFNQVTPDSFDIVADYQQTKTNELTYLIPKLVDKPEVVSSVRIVPEKIDFLIHN